MKNKALAVFFAIFFISASQCYAYWIWTPESRKWTNPKYATKDTPVEQLTFAKEILDSAETERAMSEFQKLIRRFPRSFEASEAQFFIGQCLEQLKMPYKAFQGYQKVIDKYPFSERTPEIVKRQFDIADHILEGKERSLWDVISTQEYPVVEILRAVISNEPYGEYAAASYYKLGMFHKNLHLLEEAKKEFDYIITDYPDSDWVKPARYQIAFCDALLSGKADYDQESARNAQEGFEKFLEDFPDAELSDKARDELRSLRDKEAQSNFKIAQFYERQKSYDSAKMYYQFVIDRFSDTAWAGQSLEKIQNINSKKQ